MIQRTLIMTGFFLVIILLVGSCTGIAAMSQDNTEYIVVDKKATGSDYSSIQQAIDNAPAGSVIYVQTGMYSEIIDITKPLTLYGEDKETVRINPVSTINGYAIQIRSSGVKLSGLGITNRGGGLYASGVKICAQKTTIEDCNIFDTPVGIAVWTSDNIISNCHFWGCADEGIALLGSPGTDCNNNTITFCDFYANCDGIELQGSSDNVISNCNLSNNTHSGIDAITSTNNRNVITRCSIRNNRVHGIYLSQSSYNKILDCVISHNDDGNVISTEGSEYNEIRTKDFVEFLRQRIRSMLTLVASRLENSELHVFTRLAERL